MTYKELDRDAFMFRKLKNLFPKEDSFFFRFEGGDYYNTSKTIYYNKDGKEIHVENHGTFG